MRSVSTRIAPDRDRLAEFAKTLSQESSPVLICGAAIARGNGWNEAVAFAEALGAPVWAAPASERTPFPENHSPYCGGLPFATRPLSEKLKGHDVALVISVSLLSLRARPVSAGGTTSPNADLAVCSLER